MTELPDLPPVPRVHRPLPPGGAEAAMARGVRRRTRILASAGGATTALALVVVATVTLPGGGDDSLGIADPPPPDPVPTLSADASPSPTTSPQAVPLPDGAPAASPSPGGATPTAAATGPDGTGGAPVEPEQRRDSGARPSGSPRPGATGGTTAPSPGTARPAYEEDTDEDAMGQLCTPSRGIGSCTYTGSNGGVVRRGMQAQTYLGQCNGQNSVGDLVFRFAGGQEKDVVVTDEGGAEVFRFSATVRYVQGPHERRARVGRCVQWTGRWDLVTTDGRPVPAGEYRMSLTVRADEYVYENAPPSGADGAPYVQEVSGSVTVLD